MTLLERAQQYARYHGWPDWDLLSQGSKAQAMLAAQSGWAPEGES